MKFIADSMLGRLAKWMRIIGCDVAYYSDIQDAELVDLAFNEGRIILTRDTLLIKRRKAKGNCFFVHGDNYEDQLRQVVLHFSIDPSKDLLSRCVECNLPLLEVEKTDVNGTVPQYVFITQQSFSRCPGCRKVYWSATHREEIVKSLKDIFKE